MPAFPTRSPGVLVSPIGDRAIAFDLMTETAHLLNGSAGALLEACDGAGIGESIRHWATESGTTEEQIAADVAEALTTFEDLGLVGRSQNFEPPTPPTGCTSLPEDTALFSAVHPVIDYDISFRSTRPELLTAVDAHLGIDAIAGTVARENPGTALVFDLCEGPSGSVTLTTDREWEFPSLRSCLDQLTSVVNEYAVWTHSCAALHAGAVRSPGGGVVLLPAPSGAGKSTLTAAFVAAGWDYLGDEAIGVRLGSCTAVGYPKRLAIDPSSRKVLGLAPSDAHDLDPAELRADVARLAGDVGPITRVLLATFTEGAEPQLADLSPQEAAVELLANTLNLARAGQNGLDGICDVAVQVPVQRLVHGHAPDAVAYVERHWC